MKNDEVLKKEGIRILKEKLGAVDMERFLVLMNREHFDYTKWRQNLFENLTLEELAKRANEYSKGI